MNPKERARTFRAEDSSGDERGRVIDRHFFKDGRLWVIAPESHGSTWIFGPVSLLPKRGKTRPSYTMATFQLEHCESFARLADVSFPASSKLFPASWCPTMDLFVMAVPLSNRHRLGLWKMGGTKVWDVEVAKLTEGATEQTHSIVNVAWSPDGGVNFLPSQAI